MAEEGKESRFVCKLCSRKFSCGKSLGGHMRSHVVANSTENPAEFHEKFVNESNSTGYVLRENPKKTWRARPPLQMEKVCICKQCGKGFQSMKALCGHMACHSEKERERERGANSKDDEYSWTTEINHKMMVFDSQSESETEEEEEEEDEGEERTVRTRLLSKSRKRCKKVAEDSSSSPLVVVLAAINNASSSVSEIDGQEQEEMAKCLMMLSRDSVNNYKVGVNSVVESSDNNSVVMETTKSSSIEMKNKDKYVGGGLEDETAKTTEDSDSGYFLDECAKGESEVSVDWFRRNGGFSDWKRPQMIKNDLRKSSKGNAYDDDEDDDGGIESRKRKKYGSENWNECSRMVKNVVNKKTKYECYNCKKTFKSYQALGGHRPCHKRSNAAGESGENSPDDAAYYTSTAKFVESSSKRKGSAKNNASKKKGKIKKNKVHVCPFCDRVFKNGQALGGHKRSHFLTGHDEHSLVEKPDLLDLNLPAPEADEDEGGDGGHFFSW